MIFIVKGTRKLEARDKKMNFIQLKLFEETAIKSYSIIGLKFGNISNNQLSN
jgi:hypothetical protein